MDSKRINDVDPVTITGLYTFMSKIIYIMANQESGG